MATETVRILLKRLRGRAGLTQAELASKAGVTRSWVSLVESGKRQRPEPDPLRYVAVALRVPPEVLLAAAGYDVQPLLPPARRTLGEVARELHAIISAEPHRGEVVMVRPAGIVSAGPGAPEPELIPYLPKPEERGHEFVWVEIVGNCLEPRVMAGHIAIVDTTASPRPGNIVVAQHDGEYLVKELRQDGDYQILVALQGQESIVVDERTRILGVVTAVQYRP